MNKDYVFYWQLWHHNWDNTDLETIQKLCNLTNREVVEIGCGDGRLTFQIASLCKSVIGIDIESRFIAVAEHKLALCKQPNIEFIQCHAEQLPLQDESADLVLFPWSLHEIPNAQNALAEAHRVLRKSGLLLVIALRENSDYEKIINHFVSGVKSDDQKIDALSRYENPIKRVFGDFTDLADTAEGICFRYFFESRASAYEAFEFALDYWCKEKLDKLARIELRELVDQYWKNDRVELRFPASVYVAKKA